MEADRGSNNNDTTSSVANDQSAQVRIGPAVDRVFTHTLRQSWLEQTVHTGKRKARATSTGMIVSETDTQKPENRQRAVNWSISQYSLNPLLTEEMWKRHELSLNDVKHIIKVCPSVHIWHLALTLNFPITSSAIKPSLTNSEDLVRTNKTVIAKKIYEVFDRKYSKWAHLPDKMVCEGDQFKPLNAVHEWSDEEMKALSKACGGKLHPKRQYPRTYAWRGIQVLPWRMYREHLQLVSVMPQSEYVALYGPTTRFRNTPHSFIVGSGAQQVAHYDTSECFLVTNAQGLHEWATLSV